MRYILSKLFRYFQKGDYLEQWGSLSQQGQQFLLNQTLQILSNKASWSYSTDYDKRWQKWAFLYTIYRRLPIWWSSTLMKFNSFCFTKPGLFTQSGFNCTWYSLKRYRPKKRLQNIVSILGNFMIVPANIKMTLHCCKEVFSTIKS